MSGSIPPATAQQIPLVQLPNQQDPKLSDKQKGERLDTGFAIGGAVGIALMAIVVCAAITTMTLTPVGLLIAIGISIVVLIACMVAGRTIAKNWDAILGFFGRQPTAPT
jgi:hypothetical protein